MNEASRHLQSLARELADAYIAHARPRAILLTGSATGEADFYSDLDLIVYHDALPLESAFAAARESVGATDSGVLAPPTETEYPEVFTCRGVQCQVAHTTVSAWEADVRSVVVDLDVESPLQKAISGLLGGIALHGDDLISRWRSEIVYPDALARAMVERHWRFFPLWHLQGRMSSRDASLWSRQALVEAGFALLGVLAGLNRLWFTSFQFTRQREFAAAMKVAPIDLADRLEVLADADTSAAIAELELLVAETQAILADHMPEFDSTLRRSPGTREIPWGLVDGP